MVAGGFSNSKLPTVYHHLCGLCLARKRALASGFHLMAQLLIEPLASSLWKKLLRPLCWFRKSLRIIGSSELLFKKRATPELACRNCVAINETITVTETQADKERDDNATSINV